MLVVPMLLMYSGGMGTISAASATKSFDYVCDVVSSLGLELDIGMEVTPTVSLPDRVDPNGELVVEDISADIKIDLTGDLDLLRGLINPFEGHVDEFNVVVNGETKNAVGEDGVPIPSTPHEEDDEYVPFTVNGVDTSFTVGEDDVDITVGQIEAVISSALADLPVTCTPPEDNVLATVKVEEMDSVAPVITLNGENPIELKVGEEYVEPGATAEDDVDGDVSDAIQIDGEVDTDVAGEYTVTYTVSDEAGNVATVTRTVNVVEIDPETPEEPEEPETPETPETPEDPEKPGTPGDDENGDNGDDSKNGEDGKNGKGGKDDVVITDSKDDKKAGKGGALPKTATNNHLLMLMGTLISVAGGALVFIRRKILN